MTTTLPARVPTVAPGGAPALVQFRGGRMGVQMWIHRVVGGALAVMLAAGAAGCADRVSPTTTSPPPPVTDEDFPSARFQDPTNVDNQWAPLVPGTQMVYEGAVNEDGERVGHRVVFTVTDLTKVIDGVRTVVIDDRDYVEGELVEWELAFFAQDDAGNIWLMGEYPEEWDKGRPVGAPDTWIAGVQGARAGLHMAANPRIGDPSYLQGWAPVIEFNDTARVTESGRRTCVPAGCYEGVVVTREWNPTEPQSFQVKYYAPGVGSVRVGFAGAKEKDHEVLGLARIVHLSAAELADLRGESMELERRAYVVSERVYGTTARSEA
jgi:hypothetical protein